MTVFGIFSTFFLSFFALVDAKPLNKTLDKQMAIQKFIDYARKQKQKWDIPGTVMIGVIHDDKEEIHAIGEAGIDENTLLPLASLTKAITVTVVATLVERGILSFDDPVKKYLPDFELSDKEATNKLTIRDVLSQRTGLKAFSGDSLLHLGASSDEIFAALKHLPLKKEVGRDYGYQNHFIGLIKRVVEKVIDNDFEEIARINLFEKLYMESASYYSPYKQPGWALFPSCSKKSDKLPSKYAYLYQDNYGKPNKISIPPSLFVHNASMGATMSMKDLMRWLKYSLKGDPDILPTKLYKEIRQRYSSFKPKPHDLQFPVQRFMGDIDYCMGWFKGTYGVENNNVEIYFHMGAWSGVRGLITYIPELNIGFVIWHNYGSFGSNMFPEGIRSQFIDYLLGIENFDWVDHIQNENKKNKQIRAENIDREKYDMPMPHDKFQDLAGTYENEIYGTMKVKVKGGKLFFEYRGKTIELTHQNGNRFNFDTYLYDSSYSDYDYGWIVFGYNKKNEKVLQCSIMFEGEDTLFRKIK